MWNRSVNSLPSAIVWVLASCSTSGRAQCAGKSPLNSVREGFHVHDYSQPATWSFVLIEVMKAAVSLLPQCLSTRSENRFSPKCYLQIRNWILMQIFMININVLAGAVASQNVSFFLMTSVRISRSTRISIKIIGNRVTRRQKMEMHTFGSEPPIIELRDEWREGSRSNDCFNNNTSEGWKFFTKEPRRLLIWTFLDREEHQRGARWDLISAWWWWTFLEGALPEALIDYSLRDRKLTKVNKKLQEKGCCHLPSVFVVSSGKFTWFINN